MAITSTSFKKGEGGRKQGSPNQITKNLRDFITDFLNNNRQQLQTDFESLEPKDRIIMYERFLKYSLPMLQATNLTTDFDRLTDAQLDYMIDQLKKTNDDKEKQD